MTTKKKKSVSSIDVARLAGVSQAAVSRTFNPGQSVSPETRQKVLDAARELEYSPSLIPRIMRTDRSFLVAIVTGGMDNPFFAEVIEQFTKRLQETGHQVLLVHIDSGHSLDAVVPRLAQYRADAIISALAVVSEQSARELARFKIPIISFNTSIRSEWIVSVSCDDYGAGQRIADLFWRQGARSFAYISGPEGSPASDQRLAGYRSRLKTLGIDDVQVMKGDFRYHGGFEAIRTSFGRERPINAVFCGNDLMAIGAMDALRLSLRLRVPEDVLIAGFDDIAATGWASYELTTFRQDVPRMVHESLELLFSPAKDVNPAARPFVVIPAHLIERRTTGSLGPA